MQEKLPDFHDFHENDRIPVKILKNEDGFYYHSKKIIRKNSRKLQEKIEELTNLKKISHDSLIEIQDIIVTPKNDDSLELEVRFEIMTGYISLKNYINSKTKKEDSGLSKEQSSFIFSSVLYGLLALHSRGISNIQVKPENIFIEKKSGRVKIRGNLLSFYDFKNFTEDAYSEANIDFYSDPADNFNSIISKNYDPKLSDVWNLAIILYVSLTGFLPYPLGPRYHGRQYDIFNASDVKNFFEENQDAKKLIGRMLKFNQSERITLHDIFGTSFFRFNCSYTNQIRNFNTFIAERKTTADKIQTLLKDPKQSDYAEYLHTFISALSKENKFDKNECKSFFDRISHEIYTESFTELINKSVAKDKICSLKNLKNLVRKDKRTFSFDFDPQFKEDLISYLKNIEKSWMEESFFYKAMENSFILYNILFDVTNKKIYFIGLYGSVEDLEKFNSEYLL